MACPKSKAESLQFGWTFENLRQHIRKWQKRKKLIAVALVIPGPSHEPLVIGWSMDQWLIRWIMPSITRIMQWINRMMLLIRRIMLWIIRIMPLYFQFLDHLPCPPDNHWPHPICLSLGSYRDQDLQQATTQQNDNILFPDLCGCGFPGGCTRLASGSYFGRWLRSTLDSRSCCQCGLGTKNICT